MLVFSRLRLKPLLDGLINLPLVLPPVVIGYLITGIFMIVYPMLGEVKPLHEGDFKEEHEGDETPFA